VIDVPGWLLHRDIYVVLGLDIDVCRGVDRILDEEPPRVGEVASVVSDEFRASGEDNARLPVHTGFRPSEFPLVYKYLVRTRGREAVYCLLTHFILDFLENLFMRGERPEVARDMVYGLIEDYKNECRSSRCDGFEEFIYGFEERVLTHLDYMVEEVYKWVSARTTTLEVVLRASSEFLNPILRATLLSEGYHGKRQTRVDMNVYRRALAIARNTLKQRLWKALVRNELDPGKVLEGINNVRARMEAHMTLPQFFNIIREEAMGNPEFSKYLEIIEETSASTLREIKNKSRT